MRGILPMEQVLPNLPGTLYTAATIVSYWEEYKQPLYCLPVVRLSFGDKPTPNIVTNAVSTQAKIPEKQFPEAAKKEHAYVYSTRSSKKQ